MYNTLYRIRILCAWRYLLCAVFDVNFLYGILIENKQTNILNAIIRTLPRLLSRIIYVWLCGFTRMVYVFVKINNQRRRMHGLRLCYNICVCILYVYCISSYILYWKRDTERNERECSAYLNYDQPLLQIHSESEFTALEDTIIMYRAYY
jgi:hypothetical protein